MAIHPNGNLHHPLLAHPAQPANEPDITELVNNLLEESYLDEFLADNQDSFTQRKEAPEAEKLKMIAQSERGREGNGISFYLKRSQGEAATASVLRKLIRAGAGLNLDKQTTLHSSKDLQTWQQTAFEKAEQEHNLTAKDQVFLTYFMHLPNNLASKVCAYRRNLWPMPESLSSKLPPDLQPRNAKQEAVNTDVYQRMREEVKITPAELNQLGLTLDDLLLNAAKEGHTNQIGPLVKVGGNLDKVLLQAAKAGQTDAIEPLIKGGAKVNGHPPNPKDKKAFNFNRFLSPATLAFKEGHIDTVKKLEELGGVNDYSDRFIKLMKDIKQTSDKKADASKTPKQANDDSIEKPTKKRKIGN